MAKKNLELKKPARFAVLPDERGLILGIDKGSIFQRGVVYEAIELLGEIILRPIGKYALPEAGGVCRHSTAGEIIGTGYHLMTFEEAQNNLPSGCGTAKSRAAIVKKIDAEKKA
jgi:hypothetical protein